MRDYLAHLSTDEYNHLRIAADNTPSKDPATTRGWTDIIVRILEDKGAPTSRSILQKIFLEQTDFSESAFIFATNFGYAEKTLLRADRWKVMLPGMKYDDFPDHDEFFAAYNFSFTLKPEITRTRRKMENIGETFSLHPLSYLSTFDEKTGSFSGQFEGAFTWPDKLEIFQQFYFNRRDFWNDIYEGQVIVTDLNPEANGVSETYIFQDGIISQDYKG